MKNIQEIEAELVDAAPGTVVLVKGYTNSAGNKADVSFELLGNDAFIALMHEDLKLLQDAAEDQMILFDDLTALNMLAAKQQLTVSRKASIGSRDSKEPSRGGAAYTAVGGSLAVLDSAPGALYILGVKIKGAPMLPKPAKGSIPRARQRITALLDLPSRYYAHSIKLADGKFDDLVVLTKVAGTANV